ncbi:hypothetical protein ACWYVZ_05815 [Pediococcus acidilactici]
MITQLKHNFFQISFLSMGWLTLLISIYHPTSYIMPTYLWHLFLIAVIVAGVFGVIYPYLWNYTTWGAIRNVGCATLTNFVAIFSGLGLFSNRVLKTILPFWWEILILTLILHILMFYIYRNYQNKKLIQQLNSVSEKGLKS